MKNRLIVCSLLCFCLASCNTARFAKLDFLKGDWKVQGKDQYEVWWPKGGKSIEGVGYRLDGKENILLETLLILNTNREILYEATVKDQNDGATIVFRLNKKVKDRFSFENLQHDFPKKIQYRPLSEDRVEVTVQGDNGNGFSYILEKVDAAPGI